MGVDYNATYKKASPKNFDKQFPEKVQNLEIIKAANKQIKKKENHVD